MTRVPVSTSLSVRTFSVMTERAAMNLRTKSAELSLALDVYYGTSEGEPRAWYEPRVGSPIEIEVQRFLERHYPKAAREIDIMGTLALGRFVTFLVNRESRS